VQHFRDRGAGLPDGALAGGAAGNQLGRALDQHGVLGHQRRGFQDSLAITGGMGGTRLQFIVHGLGCGLQGCGGFLGVVPAASCSPAGGSLMGLGICRTVPMMRPGLTPTPGKFCTEGPRSLPVARPADLPGGMPGSPELLRPMLLCVPEKNCM
jgi:hypothetical protein